MKKPLTIAIGILVIGVLGIAYYGLSPLFITIEADDALPVSPSSEETLEDTPSIGNPALVQGTVGHPASGTARIVRTGETVYLRYENFKTINGPDLYVYLAKDLDAKEFVNLGTIKATEGNVNYEIPTGTNLSEYRYALVWCKQFSVLFNSAELATIE